MTDLTNSRILYERPQSSGIMSDLHIYVVPSELWEEQQNLAFNQIINETVSAGFIRINADTPISELRFEIDQQLGYEVIPKDYVFCKSVGRCLAQIRQKQENILKVKHFLPPNSYCPELFVVDSLVVKRSQTTSDSSKTFNSFNDRPYLSDPYPNSHGPELRTGRLNNFENFDRVEIKEDVLSSRKNYYEEERTQRDLEQRRKARDKADFEKDLEPKANYDENKSHPEIIEIKSVVDGTPDLEQNRKRKDKVDLEIDLELETNYEEKKFHPEIVEIKHTAAGPLDLKQKRKADFEIDLVHKPIYNENKFHPEIIEMKQGSDGTLESRRNEIDDLQREIMKRYKELDNLEKDHQNKLLEWEEDEENRRKQELERRKLFEQMEAERRRQEDAIISKQREELIKLGQLLETKHMEIKESEQKLMEERENREKMMAMKQKEIENLKGNVDTTNSDPEIDNRLIQMQKEIEEMEKKQKELEAARMAERIDAENEFKKAQIEFENLKSHWDEERKFRDREYADRIAEEERLRGLSEQKRSDHEKRMDEERQRMMAEREKFEEEQKHWEEERMRYDEEEKRRVEEMELAIKNAYENKPMIQKFELTDVSLVLQGASDSEQLNHLKNILQASIKEREMAEKRREDAVKKIRISQMNIQTKRNQIRDMWKKKYFDEKKKTPPLEDQLHRYKEEIEVLQKKLLGFMETGIREHQKYLKRNGIMSPSNKANLILQATRIQHEIENLHQQIGHCQMRLSAETKLRAQTETELKILRIDAMQNKIRLSRTRSDQLAIMSAGTYSLLHSYDYSYSPRNGVNNENFLLNERLMQR